MGNRAFSQNRAWEMDISSSLETEMSKVLKPLHRHRNRLLVPDGISLASVELDIEGFRHEKGWIQAWTGDWVYFMGNSIASSAPSVDQLISNKIARSDRLPSLEIGIDGAELARPIFHSGQNQILPMHRSPDAVWDRMFGLACGFDTLGLQQSSALAFAHAEHLSRAETLGAADRTRLEAHAQLIEDIQNRLTGMAGLNCQNAPDIPPVTNSYDDKFDAFSDLVTAAFAMDVTRVVGLSLGELPCPDFGWPSYDDYHKSIAHDAAYNSEKMLAMSDYTGFHAAQVARLVDKLEQMPDTDGQSIMDNTLIVWGSEMAEGWHGYHRYCPVIIGGQWHFRTGRYLHLPHRTPVEMNTVGGITQWSGKPHQHLLVSVAQAMGLETEVVGISKLESQNGAVVDCSGPLEGLV
jgi:hypothetical protein